MAGNPTKADLCVLLAGILSAIGSGVPFPIIGIYFGELLNDFNQVECDLADSSTASDADSSSGDINSSILMIVYLAIAQFVLIYLYLLCWTLYGARLAERLRETYLRNLLRQEPSYFDKLPPGEVASRLSSDIQTIRSGTSEKVGICLASVSFFVTAYVVAFIKDSVLAAILLSLIPAYFIMSFVGSHYIEKYSGLMSDYAASASSIASEGLSNLVVVHAFGANARLEEKFSKALKASETEGMKKASAVGLQSGVMYFVAYSANGLAFWKGARQIAQSVSEGNGGATVGSTFTVIFVLIEATLLLSQVAPFVHLFTAAVASYNKLREDMDRVSLIDGTTDSGFRLTEAEGGFEFRDVSFCYPSRPEVTVLDHVNVRIPASKHTAIVGYSGSGKSTIAGLVTRLYDPDEGQVFFDGHDLKELNTHDLRSFIGLVQQEPSLLDRSILENIAHGLINSSNPAHAHLRTVLLSSELSGLASDVRDGMDLAAAAEKRGPEVVEIVDLARKAAVLADAESFIVALQHGYGTSVGSSGRLISGGQKQRISLARALVKDPAVLILDEATAALDSKSEQRIQRAISNIIGGRTVLTIAHRLSTITSADNIIVMHKGHVVEQGDHATLMAKDGAYAELVNLQNLKSVPGKDETPHPTGDNTASSVQFRDVHFAYPARPDVKVLTGLTLDIQPGHFCALVGPSGAGKSTIISLIERLYTPESGAIIIDGLDVTKQRGVSFRDTIALVPQESVLFEGSIEFNLSLGAKPGQQVTMEEIEEACKLANIHDVIKELPDGYQTLCGPNGNQFSGGQKQRLSIARALVRKPKLLILDEPTSALDAESERLLQDGLEKAARGITVIAIAHRLHTIRKANRIYLIEAGKCVEQGTHEELLQKSASYRSNVMHQTVAS
ncbi:hypothetical protein VPNG_09943 [Cytospora leucostoma]|uniref:Leptomycin B resistance protein pmd1 n=1 Tax=Cytospora leucostoma TaxID=1230097 RepID=A0A423VL15_9PEZI|nr:hypothetical protein VPNG_09943 [Cytospora leucostoma]